MKDADGLTDQSQKILEKIQTQLLTADERAKVRTGLEYIDTMTRAGQVVRWLANVLVKAAAAVAAVYFLWNTWGGK